MVQNTWCVLFFLLFALNRVGDLHAQSKSFFYAKDTLKASVSAQIAISDSSKLQRDSLQLPTAKNSIKEKVEYNANDSIVYDIKNKKMYLYDGARLGQGKMELKANHIEFDQENKLVHATFTTDSLGEAMGKPLFSEGTHQFEANDILYNMDSKKGKIKQLVTKEGEGYLRGEEVKKNQHNEMFARRAYYTTCSLEDPHFKIQVGKVKIIPDELIVSGPAQLIIENVPTPLVLPFGIFPLTKEQKSGVLLPAYGYSPRRGYFFTGGGYYFGFSDYMDLALTGDIYTNLSWRLNASSAYKKRYKFGGFLELNYAVNREGDPIEPDFTSTNNFFVRWGHSQDPKASRNGNFSADVNFGSARYNREFGVSNNAVLTNTLTSAITYRRSFTGTPLSMSIVSRLEQNTNTNITTITLPNLNLTMSRIQPFKRKMQTGMERWYEKIGVTYNMDALAKISAPDSMLFAGKAWDKIQYGLKHQATTSTDISLLKYFKIQPSFNYSETWQWKTIREQWLHYETYRDTIINEEAVVDTIPPHLETRVIDEFKRGMQFNGGASLSTRMYGILSFRRGKIKAIRHEIRPSINFSWRPDFGAAPWNYYRTVPISTTGKTKEYSIFQQSVYPGPANGKQSSLNLSIGNNLQMKVFSKKDTSGKNERKITLLENLTLSGGYNFADETGFPLSQIALRGNTKIGATSVNFDLLFDPYTINESGTRKPIYLWNQKRKLLRLQSLTLRFPLSFSSAKGFGSASGVSSISSASANALAANGMGDEFLNPPADFIDFKVPWSISGEYYLGIVFSKKAGKDTSIIQQTLNFDVDMNLTNKWKLRVSSGYDFTQKSITRTTIDVYRDLHCWEMMFNISPFGAYKNYMFTLRVKAAVLQDLKLMRRRYWRDL